LQEREMELIRRAGGRVAVINETNIDDIKLLLEG
jgi:hypothetical protein